MAEPIEVIELEYPIEHGKELIERLEIMRRPRAKDLRGMPAELCQDHLQIILGRITGQPPSVIGELDLVDMFKGLEVVESFLPGGQTAGGTV